MAPARFLQQGWRLHRPCQRTAPVSIFCCFFGLYDNVTMHSPALQENGVPMPSHEPGVGIPVQKYLQSHFINAMKKVAEVLKDEPNVVGFDTLNEPSNGWVGYEELDKELLPFRFGALMTPWQAMQLGSGVWPADRTLRHRGCCRGSLDGSRHCMRRGPCLINALLWLGPHTSPPQPSIVPRGGGCGPCSPFPCARTAQPSLYVAGHGQDIQFYSKPFVYSHSTFINQTRVCDCAFASELRERERDRGSTVSADSIW